MNRIGIIGANGGVGKFVIQILQQKSSCLIRGGYKTTPPNYSIVGVEWKYVDVLDKDLLYDFCRGCDIIVNCAGPMQMIQDKIAKVASEMNICYLDSYGTEELQRRIAHSNEGGICILGAGVYPGLTSILAKYSISQFDEVKRCKGVTGSCERISKGAAIDLLYSNAIGFGIVGSAIKDGRVVIKKQKKEVIFSHVNERKEILKKRQYAYMPSEIISFAKTNGLNDVEWFNLEVSEAHTIILAKAYQKIMSGSCIDDEVEALLEIKLTDKDYWNIIQLTIEGKKDGMNQMGYFTLYNQSAYELTGKVLAGVTLQVLNKSPNNGTYWSYEVADEEVLLELLKEEDDSILSEKYYQIEELAM